MTALELARGLVLGGHYDEAIVALDELVEGGGGDAPAARLLLLETLAEVGRYQEARAVIPARAPPETAAAGVELLLLVGDHDAAESLLRDARARHPQSAELALGAALLALERGAREAARGHLASIRVPSPSDSTVPPRQLVVAGRAAWLRSALRSGGDEFQTAKDLFQLAHRRDPDLMRAHLLAAALYMEKYESRLARGELGPILVRNPRHPEANLLIARIDFVDGRYRRVEEICRQALEVNPQHPGALELLAAIDLTDGEIHSAAASIEAGLLVNPRSKRLRSLRAAMLAQIGDRAGAEAEARSLLAADPGYAEVFQIMGGALDRLRRYDEAAALYRRAMEVDPEFAPAANALALLHMRDGREEEAREWLSRGFELDRYNIRTFNMRRLLETLDGYERFETRHFVIRVDEPDRALVPLLARELEAIYEDQTGRFGFEPDRKTTIEVFPDHQLVSGRLVGLPGLGGIPAACLGPIIVTDSPRIWAGRKSWRTVMAHEFGHVLALTHTRKLVPHWFTEGLSVVLEEREVPERWHRIARRALEKGTLLGFAGLNHGFTRARSMLERNLAYHKSGFAVRRLIDTRGWQAVLDFLDDYAIGRSTAEIIEARLGIKAEAFGDEVDRLFHEQVVRSPVWSPPSRGALMEEVRAADEHPEDADAQARMAFEWMRAGELETAVSEALKILEDHPAHPEARFVLGHALLEQGEPYAAAEHLEALLAEGELLDRHALGYLLVRDLGMVYADLDEDGPARELLEEAIAAYPSDPEPHRKLAEVHERAGRIVEALEVLDRFTRRHPETYDDMLRMASLAEGAGRPAMAAAALERALGVRPWEADTAARLAARYREAGDPAGAIVALETRCLLRPGDVAAHAALVELCLEHGPVETARRYAPHLLELDPENAAGRRALERP